MAQEQLELREASGNEKPVFGISEWMCYYILLECQRIGVNGLVRGGSGRRIDVESLSSDP